MTSHRGTAPWARAVAVVAVPVALLASACGGSTPSPSAGATTVPAGSAVTTAPAATGTTATPAGTTATTPGTTRAAGLPARAMDKTVWWSPDLNQHGLVKLHFTQAQLDPTATVPTITLSYTAENIQHATRYFSFGSESVLTVGGQPTSQPQGQQLQLIPGAATDGTVVFQVDATATLDDAVLVLGDPDSNQSIVPLRSATAVTTTPPETGFVSGTLHGLDHDIAISSSILYADTTLGRKGTSVIALTVAATYTGPGGGLIGTDNFSLKMPDGADTPGVQIVGEPLEPLNDALNVGETSASQLIGFEVDQPAVGSYTLTYTSAAATDQDPPATMTFSIVG